MASLNFAAVNKEAYRCWFKMNETTVITVDTPVGRTETATVHEIVPQGSGGAALASAMDLALCLKRYFAGSKEEICYSRVRTQPQAWQDDILKNHRKCIVYEGWKCKAFYNVNRKGFKSPR